MGDEAEGPIAPHPATLIVVVAVAGAALEAMWWADQRYRRWSEEMSVLTGPRARVAALRTGYQKKRSGLEEAVALIGEIFEAVEEARARAEGAAPRTRR
jgi:hypothetical protein